MRFFEIERTGDGAWFDFERRYRYLLWRTWGDPTKRLVVSGINPSRADEKTNDHTVSKLIGFGRAWGFGALDVINPFAFVSTDQRKFLEVEDPIGNDNDAVIASVFFNASRVVWAWGRGKSFAVQRLLDRRIESLRWIQLCGLIRFDCEVGTFGFTNSGHPKHPLTLPYSTPFLRTHMAVRG